jgi:dihydroorotase
VAVAQILALVAQYRVRVHLTQLSTGQAVDLLRHAREHELPVTADVSVHQLMLNEHHVGDFDPAYHLDPPLRSESDRLRLQAGVEDGLIDAISSGHSPHELEAKQEAFPATAAGLSGFETLLSLSLMLVEQDVLSLSQVVERMSAGPANIHRLAVGGLAAGQPADVCVFDPNQRWTVDESTWLSRGRNTPYMGQQMPGVVRYTIVQGRVVYQGG